MNLETVIDEMEGTVPDLRAMSFSNGRRIGTVSGKHMTIDKDRVKKAFSRQAPVYEKNAPLQRDVAERLIAMIVPFTLCPRPLGEGWGEGRRVLDIGIGTGFATKEFLGLFPFTNAFGCDIARGMLKEAGKTGAVLAEADAEHLPYKDDAFDLAFSSLAFQWTNLCDPVREAFRVLKPGGALYFATFGDKTLWELADSYNSAKESMGREETVKTMEFKSSERIKTFLEANSFNDVKVNTELTQARYKSPEALLRSLKAIGAGNPSKDFHPSRSLLNETFRIYRERYGDEYGISATFEVIYARGTKG